MNEILHANIFFIIASVATVIFCIFLCVILFYVLKIVRSVQAIAKRIEEGSEMIADDVSIVRSLMKGGLAGLFSMFGGGSPKRRRGGTIKEESTDDE